MMSINTIREQSQEQSRQIMAMDMTPEMEKAAQKTMADNEKHRQKMIAAYEEDGLMPYERPSVKSVVEDGIDRSKIKQELCGSIDKPDV